MFAQLNKKYVYARPYKTWSRLISYLLFEGRPITTKGRWINPFVFSLLSIIKIIPIKSKVNKPTFILGTGRSGTTVLGIVLSMHEEIGYLNEPKAIWHALYENEDLNGNYTKKSASYRLGKNVVTKKMKIHAHRIYSAYLCMTNTKRIVDKYPEIIFRVSFIKEIFPDAQFIFISRNGIDTSSSINKWSERLGKYVGSECHDWWGVDRKKWNYLVEQIVSKYEDFAVNIDELRTLNDQTAMAAVEWIVSMREGLQVIQQYPGEVLHISYEEFCENPLDITKKISEFMHLGEDVKYSQYACSAIKKSNKHPDITLPEYIKMPFNDMQEKLGYVNK